MTGLRLDLQLRFWTWQEAYQYLDSMTVPELRDFLKTKDLPVSGKKMDLIAYLIFKEYPDLGYQFAKTNNPIDSKASLWVRLKYELWLDTPEGFLATGRSFDAINYQDINSKVA